MKSVKSDTASKYNLEGHIAKFHRGVTGVIRMHSSWLHSYIKDQRGGFISISIENTSAAFCNKVFAGVNELEEHKCSAKLAPSCKFCQKEFLYGQNLQAGT